MNKKKTLAVCGGSYFTTDLDCPGQSFSEILAAKNNLQLENLARGGCSNFGVALQVNKAIELAPDFIIVGCVSHDRIDIPANKDAGIIKNFMNWNTWSKQEDKVASYDRNHGLLNIVYSHATREMSHQYSNKKFETVVSESINNLLWTNTNYNLENSVINALKQYITYHYDSGIKQQTDCWIMSDAARRLVASGIPFLIYIEELFNHDYVDDIAWLDRKYKVTPADFSVYSYRIGRSRFHLEFDDSKLFALDWQKRLIKENFI
jgi:hypothetical protein